MTVKQSHEISNENVGAHNVENYLYTHPEFFIDNPQLLADIKLPHPSGKAISLIERQVHILRDKNKHINSQLNELIIIAQDNGKLIKQLHKLALRLISSKTFAETLSIIDDSFRNNFKSDAFSIRWIDENIHALQQQDLSLAIDTDLIQFRDTRLEKILSIIKAGDPHCCAINEQENVALFGEDNRHVKSAAIMPILLGSSNNKNNKIAAIFSIGSTDTDRFSELMDKSFLKNMGQLISCKISGFF